MASAIRSRLRAGMLTVPGVFVGYLRAGLHLQLGNAASHPAQPAQELAEGEGWPDMLSRSRAGVLFIPSVFVGYLRAGLHLRLAKAAEEVGTISLEPRHWQQAPEYTTARSRRDADRALLDVIGWDTKRPEPDVRVNIYRHRESLLGAFGLVSEVAFNMLKSDGGVDREEIFGLRFFVYGVEQWVAASPSVPSPGALALLVGGVMSRRRRGRR